MAKHYIHAVHSVKGGSGKSSFSFALANNLLGNDFQSSEEAEKDETVLLIDTDFRGTSLDKFFIVGQEGKKSSIFISNKSSKYFNDLLEDNYYNIDEHINTCIICNKQNTEIDKNKYKKIDIIFSSGKYSDKKKFLYSRNDLSSEKIGVERFEQMFEGVMKKINIIEKYKHLVFDMSPNSDEYTNSMLSIFSKLSKDKKDVEEKEFEFIHYIVLTDDVTHIEATTEYIMDLTSKDLRDKSDVYSDAYIVIVINQNYNNKGFENMYGQETIEKHFENLVGKIKTNLSEEKAVSKETMKKIIFLYSDFNEYFFEMARTSEIKDSDDEIQFNIRNFHEIKNLYSKGDKK